MTFLANIPIWVYFIVLALTFMVVHVLALRANQPQNRLRSIGGRVASSILLLLALFVSAVAGFVSGRTATPQLPPRAQEPAADASPNDETPPG